MSNAKRNIFVTTALPYANGAFHFGHILEYIQADIWVRHERMCGNNVHFVCADDAHGAPIMIAASKQGVTPQEFVAKISAGRQQYLDNFYINFDHWHCTESPENTELSQDIYRRLKDAGLIYTTDIEQFYDEEVGMFLADRFIKGTCPKCGGTHIHQEEDVLDTWFSSALWPFSTLGWPEHSQDLDYFYPTDVLVTGYDIIFFWVIRMVFSGIEQTGKLPFHTVLIHGLVRDSQGRKMSKSYGNSLQIAEDMETIWGKVRTMMTDPARERRTDKGTPEKCPVWDVHKFFNKDAQELAEIHEGCLNAGIGCVDCKKKLMAHLTEMMDPIQKRRAELAKRPDDLKQILETGAARARKVAEGTMENVYSAMNLIH